MNKYTRHMMFFSEIVDAGSLSSAATQMGISKSVVSEHLKALEVKLGVTLINRNTRQQVLTSIGQQFYERCQQMNEVVNLAWHEVHDQQNLVQGKIRISAPNAFLSSIVAPAISELVKTHKNVQPILLGSDNQVCLIEDKIDLAIRVGKMPSSEFKQRKIGEFKDVLCASHEYMKEHKISSLSMIEAHESIQKVDYVANNWQGINISHWLKHKTTHEEIKISFEANRQCNSLYAVIAMVRAGCGFGLLPDFVFRAYKQRGELVEVFPEYQTDYVKIYAVYAHNGAPATLVRLAIDAIEKKLEELIFLSGAIDNEFVKN
jgi:DNA-binding transcriptional LysR family regulator